MFVLWIIKIAAIQYIQSTLYITFWYISQQVPVKSRIRIVQENPREFLAMSPLEMLRYSWAVRPPPPVAILPLPYNHRMPVLLPLSTHPVPSNRSVRTLALPTAPWSARPLCGISHARATHTRAAGAWEHFRVFPQSPRCASSSAMTTTTRNEIRWFIFLLSPANLTTFLLLRGFDQGYRINVIASKEPQQSTSDHERNRTRKCTQCVLHTRARASRDAVPWEADARMFRWIDIWRIVNVDMSREARSSSDRTRSRI